VHRGFAPDWNPSEATTPLVEHLRETQSDGRVSRRA
jgi:hypothetical protein